MTKPTLEEALNIIKMKEEAKALYEQIDTAAAALSAQHGAGRFDYDLGEDDGDGRYLKLELTDNVEVLKSGKTVWKITGISPVSMSSQRLKRCPESLK